MTSTRQKCCRDTEKGEFTSHSGGVLGDLPCVLDELLFEETLEIG